MSGPITWAAVGALLPLIGAAISFGVVLAKVNRLVVDQSSMSKDLRALSDQVHKALQVQASHTERINGLYQQTTERERELLNLLKGAFGVSQGTRGGATENGP